MNSIKTKILIINGLALLLSFHCAYFLLFHVEPNESHKVYPDVKYSEVWKKNIYLRSITDIDEKGNLENWLASI